MLGRQLWQGTTLEGRAPWQGLATGMLALKQVSWSPAALLPTNPHCQDSARDFSTGKMLTAGEGKPWDPPASSPKNGEGASSPVAAPNPPLLLP